MQLWMDSWNVRYPGQEAYCDKANGNGYYVRSSTGSVQTSFEFNSNKNNGGELYFKDENSLKDGKDTVSCYWIASPSAGYSKYFIVMGNGLVGCTYYDYQKAGLRPVVCLQSNISLK